MNGNRVICHSKNGCVLLCVWLNCGQKNYRFYSCVNQKQVTYMIGRSVESEWWMLIGGVVD